MLVGVGASFIGLRKRIFFLLLETCLQLFIYNWENKVVLEIVSKKCISAIMKVK